MPEAWSIYSNDCMRFILSKTKNLADSLYEQVRNIAPSLIRYTEPSEYDATKYITDVVGELKNQ